MGWKIKDNLDRIISFIAALAAAFQYIDPQIAVYIMIAVTILREIVKELAGQGIIYRYNLDE